MVARGATFIYTSVLQDVTLSKKLQGNMPAPATQFLTSVRTDQDRNKSLMQKKNS
jgi:hypothetical protein